MPPDPIALLRSRSYLALLVLAAIIGVPISAAAYFFLALVSNLQERIFTDLPNGLGFDGEPPWWPAPLLAAAGVLVGLTIRYLPGTGGRSPADGFKAGEGAPLPIELPGVLLAALATLSLLIACKGLAYETSLSGFRGGPVFPSMFIGAAGGMALSHLPGLSLVPGMPWASARCAR